MTGASHIPPDHSPGDELAPGIRAIDHTADVGLELVAPGLQALFARAAVGLERLIGPAGDDVASAAGDGEVVELTLELDAPDVALLLADWLRELLFLRQVRGRMPRGATFETLSETSLVARVMTVAAPARAVREIKGVTYHGLLVERVGEGWRARVIFDV